MDAEVSYKSVIFERTHPVHWVQKTTRFRSQISKGGVQLSSVIRQLHTATRHCALWYVFTNTATVTLQQHFQQS